MANSFLYKDKLYSVGSSISITYKFKEGDKFRKQIFKGIILQVKGSSPVTKMITVRHISKSGIAVEKIIPLASPFLESISLIKKSSYSKAKAYFIRDLSEQQMKAKLFRTK